MTDQGTRRVGVQVGVGVGVEVHVGVGVQVGVGVGANGTDQGARRIDTWDRSRCQIGRRWRAHVDIYPAFDKVPLYDLG